MSSAKKSPARSKRDSKFVDRFTELAVAHLSKLPDEEQERLLKRLKNRVGISDHADRPKPARTHETPAIPLLAQGRE